jgi:2-keto-3-deoxy-L-rhamnonate aldolase RhmA
MNPNNYENQKLRGLKRKYEAILACGGKCTICGYDKNIAALDYLDGCILGMHDLSGSINKLGEVFSPENTALAKMAIDAFSEAGKTVGVSTYAIDEGTLTRYRDMGINMISSGADYDYILRYGKKTLDLVNNILQIK